MASVPTEFRKFWLRFQRNRPALAGLGFITAAVGIALFAYGLAPDNSPDANTQIPEIALRPPGFQVDVLPLRLNRTTTEQSWLSILFSGRIPAERWIPVEPRSVHLDADSFHFQRFGLQNKVESYPLPVLLFAVQDSLRMVNGYWVFRDEQGQLRQLEKGSLRDQVNNSSVLRTRHFPLGTDKYGRCMLSRLLLGFRVSLLVGCIAVAISLTLGLLIGALGGYFGGRVDDAVMLLVNTVWSIPTLLLVFVIVLALGRGVGIIFLAVGLTMWVEVARVVRGQVIALRNMPFVEAARSMGMGDARILRRHILPNLLGPVLVVAAGNFATAILLESGLSYLGFGVQPPAPSWGTMLNENYGYALGGKPLLALAPAAAIAFTVLAFNLVGNGLRDALDVRSKE